MIRFFLKLIGASFLVLWWILSGFFKKTIDTFSLIIKIKNIFVNAKKNPRGKDNK